MSTAQRFIDSPRFAIPQVTAVAGPEFHAASIPARMFTGDFYFIQRDSLGRLWFALGDVAGKGLDAAVYMAMIDEHLEALIDDGGRSLTPAEVVRSLDAALRPHFPFNRFATAVVGVCEPGGILEIVNAGHCEPLLRTQSGVGVIRSHGPVIGIHPRPEWSGSRFHVANGDLLLMYSDGILEARNGNDEEFGLCRIANLFGRSSRQSARDLAEELLTAATRFRNGSQEDDVTVMALRW